MRSVHAVVGKLGSHEHAILTCDRCDKTMRFLMRFICDYHAIGLARQYRVARIARKNRGTGATGKEQKNFCKMPVDSEIEAFVADAVATSQSDTDAFFLL